MSVKVMALVWDTFPRGGSDMLVMLALADWCNHDGASLHPSMRAVAEKCRLSEVQARRIMHGLIADGFLSVVGNASGGAPGTTRQYRIHLDRLRASAVDTRTPLIEESPTAIADETPIADERAIAHDRDASRGRSETPLMDESQTVIEPLGTTRYVVPKPVKQDSCPHKEIIEIYHEKLRMCPRIRAWTPARAQALRARWNEEQKRQNLGYWERLFEYIEESEFLTGRSRARDGGKPPFMASLDWIVKAENFAKIIEGRYHHQEAA